MSTQSSPNTPPESAPLPLRVFHDVYPYFFFLTTSVAFIRFCLFMLHVYNPYLTWSWLPKSGRLVELLICIGYALPAIGVYLARRYIVNSQWGEQAYQRYSHQMAHPKPTLSEKWGGAKGNKWLVLGGAIFFVVASVGFALLGLARNWSR